MDNKITIPCEPAASVSRGVVMPITPFIMDWRKCGNCGWTGTPHETIRQGRTLAVDDEKCSNTVAELCPRCQAETYYDSERRKSPGHIPDIEYQLATKNLILARLKLKLEQYDRTPEVMEIKHYLADLLLA